MNNHFATAVGWGVAVGGIGVEVDGFDVGDAGTSVGVRVGGIFVGVVVGGIGVTIAVGGISVGVAVDAHPIVIKMTIPTQAAFAAFSRAT